MRRIFFIVGIIVSVFVVGGIAAVVWLARSGAELDASSKAYTNEAVAAIVSSWSPDELWKRASPDFKRVSKPEDLAPLFDAASAALGKLVEYQGTEGQALIAKSIGTGTDIRAQYVARARFEKDQAAFEITLHQINGVWLIDGFHIQSTVLMKRLAGQPS